MGGAEGQLPVRRSTAGRFAGGGPPAGVRVGACLHVTAETANLVLALHAAGAQVALCAANPLSTQDDTAAALAERHGTEVRPIRAGGPPPYHPNTNAPPPPPPPLPPT